jgi:hypothetical protein
MSDPADFAERKLERLRARTDAIRPGPGFDDWIAHAVQRRGKVTPIDGRWRAGRWALLAAAMAAAASIVLALETSALLDERVLAAFDLVEIEE